MIRAIGRYTALLGFIFATLLHLAGYVYPDLPHPAFGLLTLGLFALAPLALRGPFLNSNTLIDSLAKRIAVRVVASGLALWLLMTLIWILVKGPDVATAPHPIHFHTLLPEWRVSGRQYGTLNQQWQSLSAALAYLILWLQFSSARALTSAAETRPGADPPKASGVFPPILKQLIAGTILASMGLYTVGSVLHLAGLAEKGTSDIMAGLSFIGFVAALAFAGIGGILSALRD
jgi:hypothetical protein